MKFKNNIFSRAKNAWGYRHEPESLYELAYIFWVSLLVIVFLAALLAIVYGYGEEKYVAATLSEVPQMPNSANSLPFSADQLQAMLDQFSTRQAQYASLSATSSNQTFQDPSK